MTIELKTKQEEWIQPEGRYVRTVLLVVTKYSSKSAKIPLCEGSWMRSKEAADRSLMQKIAESPLLINEVLNQLNDDPLEFITAPAHLSNLDKCSLWHEGYSELPLSQYLGMTSEEYAAYVRDGDKESS